MPRNAERDEREAARRKEQLMKAGFELFSQPLPEEIGTGIHRPEQRRRVVHNEDPRRSRCTAPYYEGQTDKVL